ncbi:MAG TPA: hypothetical protein VGW10_04640, partial [Solirubrobacteraceae bacterium]|nr:hypothetical protein [Solirubrobacteraceae bacterium]
MRRALKSGATIVGLAVGLAAPAHAQDRPPRIEFTDKGTLTLDATRTTRATIINNTVRVIPVRARLDLFGLRGERQAFVASIETELEPGEAAQVAVQRARGAAIEGGSYEGVLSVISGRVIARRPVKAVVPETDALVTVPLVTKRTLTDGRILADDDLVLALDPRAVPPGTPAERLDLKEGARLGTVVDDGGHEAIVSYSGKAVELDSGAVGIGLKLSGLDAIGAYTGTVNLPPSAAGTPVALKVRRTDGVVL